MFIVLANINIEDLQIKKYFYFILKKHFNWRDLLLNHYEQ